MMKRLYMFLCLNTIRVIDWLLLDCEDIEDRNELLLTRKRITDDMLKHGIIIC